VNDKRKQVRTPAQVIAAMEAEFEEEMRVRREIHNQTMEGLVRPMLEAGLVDLDEDDD